MKAAWRYRFPPHYKVVAPREDVSPSVVAQIFMTQKANVICGSLFMGEMFGELFRLGAKKIPIHEAGRVYEDKSKGGAPRN